MDSTSASVLFRCINLHVHFQKERQLINFGHNSSAVLYSGENSQNVHNASSKPDKITKTQSRRIFLIRSVLRAKLNETRIIATVSMPRNTVRTSNSQGMADMFVFWGTWEGCGP